MGIPAEFLYKAMFFNALHTLTAYNKSLIFALIRLIFRAIRLTFRAIRLTLRAIRLTLRAIRLIFRAIRLFCIPSV